MDTVQKSMFAISYFIKVTLVIAIGGSIFTQQWTTLFLASLTFFLTFLPAIIGKNYKIFLPLELEFLVLIFIYATLFLGEIKEYYLIYWWWDVLLHTLSGFILALIGFFIVFILNQDSKVNLHMGAGFVALFSFTFALSIGAVWEIFEFCMDMFFGLNMQKSGIVDTMTDLIVDSIGAIIVSIGGYFYVKKVKIPLVSLLIERFTHKNPHLFKRRGRKKKLEK